MALVRAWKPDVPAHLAYRRMAQALYKMQVAGLVRREGGVWGLRAAAPA